MEQVPPTASSDKLGINLETTRAIYAAVQQVVPTST
jgi:hypothetical protein